MIVTYFIGTIGLFLVLAGAMVTIWYGVLVVALMLAIIIAAIIAAVAVLVSCASGIFSERRRQGRFG